MKQHKNRNCNTHDMETQIKKCQCGQSKKQDFQKQTGKSFGWNNSFPRAAGIVFNRKYTPKRGKKTGRPIASTAPNQPDPLFHPQMAKTTSAVISRIKRNARFTGCLPIYFFEWSILKTILKVECFQQFLQIRVF